MNHKQELMVQVPGPQEPGKLFRGGKKMPGRWGDSAGSQGVWAERRMRIFSVSKDKWCILSARKRAQIIFLLHWVTEASWTANSKCKAGCQVSSIEGGGWPVGTQRQPGFCFKAQDSQAQGKYSKTSANSSQGYVIRLQRKEACKLPKSNNGDMSPAQARVKESGIFPEQLLSKT